jgi:hypothetical protein
MFCLPRGDDLITALAARGIEPSATATIVHRHLDRFDWRQLLTSDI